MMKYQNKSFVAISAIWYERFLECSRTYGTGEFSSSVWRFYHSLLDLDNDELNIKSKVKGFIEDEWRPMVADVVRSNTYMTSDPGVIDTERDIAESQYIDQVFDFIIQAIQDSGIGWTTQDNVQNFNITQE